MLSRRENYKARKVKEKTVIGVTGMPGAGKDIVIEVFRELGFPIIVMGDEVRAEAGQRGLQPTPENVGKVMLQIRAEEGPEVLARRCIPKVNAADAPVVVIDGIRSMHEVQEYKKEFPHMKVMAVHASPHTRFKRLTKRRRSDDPKEWTTFAERDQRELSVGLGDVVATADLMIINERTIEDFKNKLRYLLKRKFRV